MVGMLRNAVKEPLRNTTNNNWDSEAQYKKKSQYVHGSPSIEASKHRSTEMW